MAESNAVLSHAPRTAGARRRELILALGRTAYASIVSRSSKQRDGVGSALRCRATCPLATRKNYSHRLDTSRPFLDVKAGILCRRRRTRSNRVLRVWSPGSSSTRDPRGERRASRHARIRAAQDETRASSRRSPPDRERCRTRMPFSPSVVTEGGALHPTSQARRNHDVVTCRDGAPFVARR